MTVCARCGKPGNPRLMVYSRHTRNHYCADYDACTVRAREDRERWQRYYQWHLYARAAREKAVTAPTEAERRRLLDVAAEWERRAHLLTV